MEAVDMVDMLEEEKIVDNTIKIEEIAEEEEEEE